MLVLSRKKNEKIIIPLGEAGVIEVAIVEIRGDKVRLGFSAPKEIPVHREEVFKAIARKKCHK
ncbi:MAG: carbon storage regulator [Euryarchaeota archaeon]|nr:carbon storage regulator [Euryarchaeota archaeon]